ncbi:MAG: SpoVG family protein [Chitinispirillaceae bacterium]
MEITEVNITLRSEGKLKAYADIVFDDCFVVRGLRVINGCRGFFVSMPSRRRFNGSFQDLAHPINNETRQKIEDKVLDAFEIEINKRGGLEAFEANHLQTADCGSDYSKKRIVPM